MPKLICQLSVEQPPATKDPPGAPQKNPHEQYFPTKSAQKFLNLIKLEAISGKANKSWPKTAAAARESGRKFC